MPKLQEEVVLGGTGRWVGKKYRATIVDVRSDGTVKVQFVSDGGYKRYPLAEYERARAAGGAPTASPAASATIGDRTIDVGDWAFISGTGRWGATGHYRVVSSSPVVFLRPRVVTVDSVYYLNPTTRSPLASQLLQRVIVL
jgi:hypothetical protein